LKGNYNRSQRQKHRNINETSGIKGTGKPIWDETLPHSISFREKLPIYAEVFRQISQKLILATFFAGTGPFEKDKFGECCETFVYILFALFENGKRFFVSTLKGLSHQFEMG
jgi:hypothetical protein